MKKCIKCNLEKELTDFYKDKSKKDGLCSHCKSCQKKRHAEYYKKTIKIKNYEEHLRRRREFYKNNTQSERKKAKQYYQENREKEIKRVKDYIKNNKEKINKRNNERYHTDSLYKLAVNIRSRLRRFSVNKKTTTEEIVGCTWEKLKVHIENQFSEGMTWDNHGLHGWHIDHIIPLSSGKTEEEIYKLSHYTNLQPLWAEENLKKSDKIFD